MKTKNFLLTSLPAAMLFLLIFSANSIGAQSKVFIAPMESNFSDYLKTAFLKYKVPVILTIDDARADYIVTGGPFKNQNKWYDTALNQQSGAPRKPIVVFRRSDQTIVWSSANGRDVDIFWEGILTAVPEQTQNLWIWLQSVDEGKKGRIANHLALDMKRDIFKKNK